MDGWKVPGGVGIQSDVWLAAINGRRLVRALIAIGRLSKRIQNVLGAGVVQTQ